MISIECLVCWVEFFILIVGVLVFLKNYLLVWLIEKNFFRKVYDNEFIKEVLKRSRENFEGLNNLLVKIFSCVESVEKKKDGDKCGLR